MRTTRTGTILLTAVLVLPFTPIPCGAIEHLQKRPCPQEEVTSVIFGCEDVPGNWYPLNVNIECGPASFRERLRHEGIVCHGCFGFTCYDVPPEDFCACVRGVTGDEWYDPDDDIDCPAFHDRWSFQYETAGLCDICIPRPCWGWSWELSPLANESSWGRVKAAYR